MEFSVSGVVDTKRLNCFPEKVVEVGGRLRWLAKLTNPETLAF